MTAATTLEMDGAVRCGPRDADLPVLTTHLMLLAPHLAHAYTSEQP